MNVRLQFKIVKRETRRKNQFMKFAIDLLFYPPMKCTFPASSRYLDERRFHEKKIFKTGVHLSVRNQINEKPSY